MRKTMAGIGLTGLLLGAGAGGAGAQEAPEPFDLSPLNDSGSMGTAQVSLDGNMLEVTIVSDGLLPGAPHAQHIHFTPGQPSVCPGPDAAGEDGILTTPEGQPAYGPIQVPLTTEGDFSADSALAVDRFPVAGPEGEVTYARTFELPQALADQLRGQQFAIVQHGVDIDESGAYDGVGSELDPAIPQEATLPANCGTMMLAAAPAQPGSTTTTTMPSSTTSTTMPTTSTTMPSTTTTAPMMQGNDNDGGQMPAGGVQTGAGGTAAEVEDGLTAGTTVALVGFAGLLTIGLAGGGLALARARRDDG